MEEKQEQEPLREVRHVDIPPLYEPAELERLRAARAKAASEEGAEVTFDQWRSRVVGKGARDTTDRISTPQSRKRAEDAANPSSSESLRRFGAARGPNGVGRGA